MSIPRPPEIPAITGLSPEMDTYFKDIQEWLDIAYDKLNLIDMGQVRISSGSGAPTGGSNADWYIRTDVPNTSVYLNINGVWSAYTNP